MAKILRDLLNLEHQEGSYGMEVEVSGELTNSNFKKTRKLGWHTDIDGSIGEGLEFILNSPSSLGDLPPKIEGLWYDLVRASVDFDNQERAGIHLHVNVQDFTVNQLFTFVCTYYLLERLLVKWCGDCRNGNHFCLPIRDAEFVLDLILTTLSKRKLKHLDTNYIRYSSLNFTSMFKFGSLEFRSMRTPHSYKDVVEWVNIIDRLKVFSSRFENPKVLVGYIHEKGLDFVLEELLSEEFLSLSQCKEDMMEGLWVIEEIANSCDWVVKNTTANPFRKPFEKGGASGREDF